MSDLNVFFCSMCAKLHLIVNCGMLSTMWKGLPGDYGLSLFYVIT